MENTKAVVQLGRDLYFNKNGNFSKDELQGTFNNMILEILDGDAKNIMHPVKGYEAFQLVVETIDAVIPEILTNQFDPFCDIQTLAFGEKLVVEITDPRLFPIAKIAAGTNNLRAQTLENGTVTVDTDFYGVKIRAELLNMLAGRINFQVLVNKVAISYTNKIKGDIFKAINNSYTTLDSSLQLSGTFDPNKFITVIDEVSALSAGADVQVYGSWNAVAKILAATGMNSYNMMDEFNTKGYLENFMGVKVIKLENAMVPNTKTLALDPNKLYIIPAGAGQKIVHIALEGDALVVDNGTTQNASFAKEYSFIKKYGMAVLSASAYSIWNLV